MSSTLLRTIGVNMTLHKTLGPNHKKRITEARDQFTDFRDWFGDVLEQEFGAVTKFLVLKCFLRVRFNHRGERQFGPLEFGEHTGQHVQESRTARINDVRLLELR
jgi:hypothetical protein